MGVVLHEGKLFGLGNQLLMLAVCLAILLSSASGLWIWWKRKPADALACRRCATSCRAGRPASPSCWR